jgi:membrane protease YdiL (CAAX protease family)
MTIDVHDTEARNSRIFIWIKRHQLMSFLILTYFLTWPFLITDALGSHAETPFRLPILALIVMGYQPTLAAVIVSWISNGNEGIRKLLKRFLIWRVGLAWYLIVIFGIGILLALPVLTANIFGRNQFPIFTEGFAGTPALLAPVMLLMLLIVSSLVNGEEFGWRGFMLPRLQSRYSALSSSLFIGIVWALFHLPLFWTVGSTQANEPIVGFFMRIIAAAIILTWIYNNTRGSVLLAMLFHGSINAWSGVFYGIDTAHTAPGFVYWTSIALFCLAALVVVIIYGPARLSRKSEEEWQFVVETG